MLLGAALVVPVQKEKPISGHSALRGPDKRGDPYGGLLQCQSGLLQGEVCCFVFRHSAISGLSSWSSLSISLARSGGLVKESNPSEEGGFAGRAPR